jgi:hypothetical protein
MSLPPDKYQEDLDYLAEYAREDWVPIHNVFVSASGILGAGASLEDITDMADTLLSELFARGVQLGDLVKHAPDFLPWSGTRQDWLARVRADIKARQDIPAPGELAWLHIP